jgi:hypothetical protein
MIPIIEPGRTATVIIELQPSDNAKDFQKGVMVVSLGLGDTGTDHIRGLVTYHLNVQVSPGYTHNPNAQFLLVTNATAPSESTQHLANYIKKEICIPVDIFNISLTGSYLLQSGENVCSRYEGKTIAILGNTFNYFQKGTREPWDLLDITEVYSLLQKNTGFMFFGPENLPSLKLFAKLASTPLPPLLHTQQSATSLPDVLSKLQKTNGPPEEVKIYTIPVKKSLFSGLDSSIKSKIQEAQKQLTGKFPLRRFLIAPCEISTPPDAKKQSEGAIAIVEGIPQSGKMIVSTRLGGNTTNISTYNANMITLSLPFADQCTMYWNLARSNTHHNVGMKVRTIYEGLVYGTGNDIVNMIVCTFHHNSLQPSILPVSYCFWLTVYARLATRSEIVSTGPWLISLKPRWEASCPTHHGQIPSPGHLLYLSYRYFSNS